MSSGDGGGGGSGGGGGVTPLELIDKCVGTRLRIIMKVSCADLHWKMALLNLTHAIVAG